jgi:hypothetical protein
MGYFLTGVAGFVAGFVCCFLVYRNNQSRFKEIAEIDNPQELKTALRNKLGM